MTYTIKCETVNCGREIATGEDYEDAKEIAIFENGADYHDEAGVWTCEACYAAYMAEGFAEAMRYEESQRWAQAERDRQTRADDLLAAADLAFDTMRERGEI